MGVFLSRRGRVLEGVVGGWEGVCVEGGWEGREEEGWRRGGGLSGSGPARLERSRRGLSRMGLVLVGVVLVGTVLAGANMPKKVVVFLKGAKQFFPKLANLSNSSIFLKRAKLFLKGPHFGNPPQTLLDQTKLSQTGQVGTHGSGYDGFSLVLGVNVRGTVVHATCAAHTHITHIHFVSSSVVFACFRPTRFRLYRVFLPLQRRATEK